MTATQDPAAPTGPRFHAERDTEVRVARPWDRLAYIIDALPAAIADLVPALEARPGDRVLDLGCAEGPYHGLFAPGVEVLGADLPGNPHAAITLNPDGTVPVPDASFDAVLSTQVLEHVGDPGLYLAECARVLRPGGRLLLSTHGIMVWHPDPVDLWRWTSEGLRHVVERAGFEVVRFEGIMGLGATGLQLFQDSLHHRLPGRLRSLLALTIQSLIRVVDRFEPAESKRRNALVFAVVATRR